MQLLSLLVESGYTIPSDIRVQVQGVLCMRAVLEVSLGLFDDIVLQVLAEWLIVGERECESACATGQCAEYR